MPNTYFQFKQFIIHQDRCEMKLSTDAVILGALASDEQAERILDIGTGTAVVALMLAQRFTESTTAGIEIDQAAFIQAKENAALSPWEARITLANQSFQEYAATTSACFDLIVSNPPYFPAHIKSKDQQRNLALHNDSLSFEDLVNGVTHVLSSEGLFWVILPERQMQDLEQLAADKGLFPHKKVIVRNHSDAPVLRVLQAFSFLKQAPTQATLCIRDQNRNYSLAYKLLLKDFLLDF